MQPAQITTPLQASAPEDVFCELFCETFGIESAQYLLPQYPFVDIRGGGRFIDYALRTDRDKIAFEIDSETYHAPYAVTLQKWEDDLLRQNSLIYQHWRVFRWTDRQLGEEPERVKEELQLFLQGTRFVTRDDFLPHQQTGILALREHQEEALETLARLRAEGVTIALLTHATGLGKTVVAIEDARRLNLRTLFVAHTRELVQQTADAFHRQWPEVTVDIFDSARGRPEAFVVVGTVQGVSANLELFDENDFGYLIVDEAHHATAETYQRIIGYFRTRFMLGMTATDERADHASLLEVFQTVAHRMELEEAIKRGLLVPIRCVRVQTNVDLRDVRFSGLRYNQQDLETKLIIQERNDLIINTYREHVPGKRAAVFCVNVRHAEMLAEGFTAAGFPAQAVSGRLPVEERKRRLDDYHAGRVRVLCACDLLNEGWDSPETEVLLMARPTMSQLLYRQQLGRGTRKAPGKEALIIFDFVDNTRMENRAISLHGLFGRNKYRAGGLVAAPDEQMAGEEERIARGEKPEVFLSLHLWVRDLELIDVFDWRQESKKMLSASRLSEELGVDPGTVSSWIATQKIKPDLPVTLGTQTYYYFYPERVEEFRTQFGLKKVTPENRKEAFMEYARTSERGASYRPVLLQTMLDLADERGRVRVSDLVAAFKQFYLDRAARGLKPEKGNVRMARVEALSDGEVEQLIFKMPFERFERRRFFLRCKEVEFVAFTPEVWRRLTDADKTELRQIAADAIAAYFADF
jgi:superfamily II DNA or RNA helicase